MDFNGGAEFGRKIADENLPITAVMCAADITALGIIHGLAERGKKVPDDYSIVGYDDIRMLKFNSSGLTTVRQNIFEKGCLCARVLLDKINNPDTHKAEKTVIKSELIIRNSTRSVL